MTEWFVIFSLKSRCLTKAVSLSIVSLCCALLSTTELQRRPETKLQEHLNPADQYCSSMGKIEQRARSFFYFFVVSLVSKNLIARLSSTVDKN